MVGIKGQRTRRLFTGNGCQAVPVSFLPAGSHSGSTGPAQIETVRMELSSLYSRVGGEGPQPVGLVSVSMSAFRWGISWPREPLQVRGTTWEVLGVGFCRPPGHPASTGDARPPWLPS